MTELRPILPGPSPKHAQLRAMLMRALVPGQAIPSERELMATCKVSRATVRKAIDDLVAEGVLQRTHGLGTFAVQPRLESTLHLASFSQDMRRRGLRPASRLVSLGREVPPPSVAAALGLSADESCWRLVRVRVADDAPIAHEDGWYPAALFPGLDRHDLSSRSLYELLGTEYDRWIDEAEQDLWAEAADGDLAATLAVEQGTPVLAFRRRSAAAGVWVEHVVSRYRGDRYQLHMELQGGSQWK
jgi:GntR family transcriptional regulator